MRNRLCGIVESETTVVLRDAIAVCRALSVSFLWVDALCIVQDDPQDWQRESSLMGQIYSNAQFTICAMSSRSCIEGFLDGRVALTVPFQSHITPGIEGTFNLTRAMGSGYPFMDDSDLYIHHDFSLSSWRGRGWALQERIMSRKLLMFGRSRLHISCAHKWQIQGEPVKNQSYMVQICQIQSEVNLDTLYDKWYCKVAEDYSGTRLTYRTDRLPAISGLARLFHNKLRDEYLAGLWKGRLHQGLNWFTYRHDVANLSLSTLLKQLLDPTAYVAPSWSWASPDYAIHHDDYDYRHRNITNITHKYANITPHIAPAYTDPYGQLAGAKLQVTTRLIGIPSDIVFDEGTVHNYGYADVRNPPRRYIKCELDWGQGADRKLLKRVLPNGLRLMLLGAKNQFRSNKPTLYGLIIYLIPDTAEFLRVGIFWIERRNKGLGIFKDCEPMTINLI
ncbi:hypothetical protein NPX13_g899 [Xylaria arbuscula]|uniref:Heterokaryon incompatibility domain-containing protein n=1 Tax=Xylaria arbuscula TaxID=114810 RepID=A0A9W8NN30_9PEZI|nr:hypothetical protein NPX13_g899 [Xylaria arbuscula]